MRGDFSTWRVDPTSNHQGVLHQQGRVTLDADLTAAELIDLAWRVQAGRDVVGRRVAALPAGGEDGFRIVSAAVVGGVVRLQVRPGRIWADGVHVHLPAGPGGPAATVERVATWLPEPLGGGGDAGSVGADVRDAVVLEVVLEELNAFQDPARLLEPALGGPDTTERIVSRIGFRLVRMAEDDTCRSVADAIADGPEGRGRLTVSLDPAVAVGGDCPTVDGGGYRGFEHHLYRVEIARTDAGPLRYVWSRFNGGLVGRGRFEAGTPDRVIITANRSAIIHSDLDSFYLEALVRDEELGHWRVAYGAMATLDSDQDLELAGPPVFGTLALGPDPVFFRLWDGIAPVTPVGSDTTLGDGIRLDFAAPGPASVYMPGDAWTFTVRAGEIANPEVLVDDAPPQGPYAHRVPLAEIAWDAAADTTEGGRIHDCRRRFRPLTEQGTCCTLVVGDGVSTFGDFDSLEEAAEHLPEAGGDLCLLPGVHFANLVLDGRRNVRVRGCARRTMVLPRFEAADQPIVRVVDSVGVEISELDLVSLFGPVLDLVGTATRACREVRVRDCRMLARRWVLRAEEIDDLQIARNRAWLLDTTDGLAAFRIRARDGLVERNTLALWPFRDPGSDPGPTDDPDRPGTPPDPCDEPDDVYGAGFAGYVLWIRTLLVAYLPKAPPPEPYRAIGGIHLRGGCDDVRLLENHVVGGSGHGVALGGILPGTGSQGDPDGQPAPGRPGAQAPTVTADADGFQGFVQDEHGNAVGDVDLTLYAGGALVATVVSAPGDGSFAMKAEPGAYALGVEPGLEVVEVRALEFEGVRYALVIVRRVQPDLSPDRAFLYRIEIAGNHIEQMALSGIGFVTFAQEPPPPSIDFQDPAAIAAFFATIFAPREILGVANVVRDLIIRNNRIHHNLRAGFGEELRKRVRTVGQGGISLGLVETGVIADNEIHDNGTTAVHPTCGVFVGYAEDLEIRGNRIGGNGPVLDRYEAEKLEGLRGGIFVRFASAFLVGGEADAQQKPAVRIDGNRVDQPAGRALTVLAFGPVACGHNYLNSERTGRWSLFDTVVGAALIVDLGGLHRQRPPVRGKKGDLTQFQAAVPEIMLPGGEVLFNDNQVRMGAGHRSLTAITVLTLDDLAFDGNQSSVFETEDLFANAALVAFTLRATDGRFREHTARCFMSLLSWAIGSTEQARLRCMNTTALNQGDHCIIALSSAPQPPDPPPHGPPLTEIGNLEAGAELCRGYLERNKGSKEDFVWEALVALLLKRQAGLGGGDGQGDVEWTDATGEVPVQYTSMAKDATQNAVTSAQMAQSQRTHAWAAEAQRMEVAYGAEAPRTVEAQAKAQHSAAVVRELRAEAEVAAVPMATPPQSGMVVEGRITDDARRGKQNLVVELVREDETVVSAKSTSDAAGYYAVPVEAPLTEELKKSEEPVFLRVSDTQGKVVYRQPEPVKIEADTAVRGTIVLARDTVPAEARAEAEVIYRKPAATARPSGQSTPLEDVKGIGPKTADKLRAAGIPDLEALMRTPGEKLVDIQGFDADVMRERARERLLEVEKEEGGTTGGVSDEVAAKKKTDGTTRG